MNTKNLIPILLLLFFSCKKELITEVPDGIIILKPNVSLVDTIAKLFPNGKNIFDSNSVLFSDTIQKKIVLVKESNVYVTFIDEGASFKNSLFWYSYDSSHVPLKASDINGNLLFPNISKKGEGGELESGYALQLGNVKFPAGTTIGFYLVVNGWKDGTIDYTGPIYYTNYELNVNGKQQYLLFKELYTDAVVLGFEDTPIDADSDKDYNDILISVSDNKDGYITTSFDLTKVIVK